MPTRLGVIFAIKKMKKILLALLVFTTAYAHAQLLDNNVRVTDTLETEQRWMIAEDTTVSLLDISYFEFSTDGETFNKDYTAGDTWLRVSNYSKTSWDTIRIQSLLWELSGDTLRPVGGYLVACDSLFAGEINTNLYKLNGDSLTYETLPTGGGSNGYIPVNDGNGSITWQPLPSGVGGAYGRNLGTSGIGVYVDTTGSELGFKNLDSGSGITLSESDSTIFIDWDGSTRQIAAGTMLNGGGALDNNVTLNLYIPEGTELTSVADFSDWIAIYDESAGQHKKVHPSYLMPDLYVMNILDKSSASFINFKYGDGLLIEGDETGALQFSMTPQVIQVNGATVKEELDTIDFVAGDNINITYEDNKVIFEASGSGGSLPECGEGQFLMYSGGEWICVDVCDYICSETIIDIINDYNDTVPSSIDVSGDVTINFSRDDCEDSTRIYASDLAKDLTNLTNIKIVSVPSVGELHLQGELVTADQIMHVTLGELDSALYYIADGATGSGYADLFTFQLLYSSNADYLGTANVNVSVDACVTESVCFGYLYNAFVIDDSREITSSDDWSVPTSTQLSGIVSYVGGDPDLLKATGTLYWNNGTGTDAYGFEAKGGGGRSSSGVYSLLKEEGNIWSSTADGSSNYNSLLLGSSLSVSTSDSNTGISIRLVKDATGLPDGTTTTYTGNDGKIYDAIVINGLYWTTESLEETEYRNGDEIPNITDNTTWSGLTAGALCLYDNDYSNACKTPLPDNGIVAAILTSDSIFTTSDISWSSYLSVPISDDKYSDLALLENGDLYALGGSYIDIYDNSLSIKGTLQLGTFISANRLDISDDGKYILIGASTSGTSLISSDYGETFSAIAEATGVAYLGYVSSTGQYMIMGARNYPYGMIVSQDYGSSWTEFYGTTRFQFGGISDDGKYMFMNIFNSAGYYVSNDYGSSFSFKTSETEIRAAMSGSGKYLWLGDSSTSGDYVSSDYGSSASLIPEKTWSFPTGIYDDIAISNDGGFFYGGDSETSLHLSTDHGNTFVPVFDASSRIKSVAIKKNF